MREHVSGVLNELCEYDRQLLVLLIACLLILAVNTLSFAFVDPESGAYVVSVMNFVGLVPLVVGIGFVLLRCSRLVPDGEEDD